MNTHYIITTLAITLFVSCKKPHEPSIVETPIYATDISFDESVLLKYPYRIKKTGSSLLIWDLHASDNYLHMFSLKNDATKYLYSFAKVGNGPEEFTNCGGIDIKEDTISVFETNKAIHYSFSINSLNSGIIKPAKTIEFPKEYIPITSFSSMGKNGKIILDNKGDSRFILLDNNGNLIDKFYNIPNVKNKELQDYILKQLWTSSMSYNVNNNTLAIATTLGDVLEIYNLKNKTRLVKVGKQGEPDLIRNGNNLTIISANGYQDVLVGDSLIYGLYSKTSFKDIKEAESKNQKTPHGGNYIYVYNLDGDIMHIYLLDRYITGFDIDTEKQIIYGLNANSNAQLCVFNISQNNK